MSNCNVVRVRMERTGSARQSLIRILSALAAGLSLCLAAAPAVAHTTPAARVAVDTRTGCTSSRASGCATAGPAASARKIAAKALAEQATPCQPKPAKAKACSKRRTCAQTVTQTKVETIKGCQSPKKKNCPKVRVRVKVKVKVKNPCRKGRRCPKPKIKTKTVVRQVCAHAPAATKTAPAPPTSVVAVTQTTQDLSQAMAAQPSLRFSPAAKPKVGVPVIQVNDQLHYQAFTGVGGAMTDTSAWLMWDELPAAQRAGLFDALFSPAHGNLSFLRVPVGASDFTSTSTPYTYDDEPAGQSDPSLSNFSVAHDQAYVLPALRLARQLNPHLYLEAVSWSPPAWMKANDALDNVDGAGSLLPQYYPTLARYFVKFLQAYAANGVPVNAITPQNEPGVETEYPGMQFNQAQEANFVAHYLRPALSAAHVTPNVFGWDLAWGPLNSNADPLVDQSASGTLTGLAWHCYFGSPSFMTGVHDVAPGSMQIVDECTTGSGDIWRTSELLIATLRNWANAVGVWNLALDPSGGPVQPPNFGCAGCIGVATVNEQTGTYSLSPDYYDLAQLSHFVQPGAVRISSPNFASYGLGGENNYQTVVSHGLDDVAFLDPDGSKVLYLYNNATGPITFAVEYDGSYVTYTIPGGATTTLTWY